MLGECALFESFFLRRDFFQLLAVKFSSSDHFYLFITIYGLRKNEGQRMKCKRVKDPILKQIT